MMRIGRFSLVFCVLLAVLVVDCAAGDAVSTETRNQGEWQDLVPYIEGRGWTTTPTPFARLPVAAQASVPESVWVLSSHSAGLCAHFVVDATSFTVRWTLTAASLAMPHMPATGVSGIDLYARPIGGKWTWIGNGQPSAATNTATFRGMPGSPVECLLYLPLYNGVSALEISLPDEKALRPSPVNPNRVKPIVFYGTSITQGACASRPGLAYTAIIGRRLGWPVVNLGFSGSGKMEPEMAAVISELDARIFVIDCLRNMSGEQIDERVEHFVRILRKKRPTTPIVLMEDSTFRANTPTFKGAKLKAIADRLAPDDRHLHFLSAKDLLGTDSEGTVDGCHPNDIGMLRHADAMVPFLGNILKMRK